MSAIEKKQRVLTLLPIFAKDLYNSLYKPLAKELRGKLN